MIICICFLQIQTDYCFVCVRCNTFYTTRCIRVICCNNICFFYIITKCKLKWFICIWFNVFTICLAITCNNIECLNEISICIVFCYRILSSWKIRQRNCSACFTSRNYYIYLAVWNILTILRIHIKCKCSICVRCFRYILCDLNLTFDDMNLINTIWIVAIIWIISLLSSSYDMLFPITCGGVRFTLIRWCRLWIISYFQIILCIIIRCCCHILFTDIGLSSIFPLQSNMIFRIGGTYCTFWIRCFWLIKQLIQNCLICRYCITFVNPNVFVLDY